jgi:hypothetical protein
MMKKFTKTAGVVGNPALMRREFIRYRRRI